MDELATANSVCWYHHVLVRDDGHILRRVLDFDIEGQRMKGRLKGRGMLKKQVAIESVKVFLRREIALCGSTWRLGVNQITAGLR